MARNYLRLRKKISTNRAPYITPCRKGGAPCVISWNDGLLAGRAQWLNYPLIGVVGLVGEHDVRFERRQEFIGADQIADLSSRQMNANRIAQGIDDSVEFPCSIRLCRVRSLGPRRLFCAPALC